MGGRPLAALLAAPLPACSSDSDEANSNSAADSSAATNSTGSGGSSGSGGGSSGSGGGSSGSGATAGATNTGAATVGSSGGAGGSSTGAGGGTAGGAGAPSDLPYANVVAVVASGSEGSYTLNVSVESSDVDCSQFADWWEVVSEDGTLLYRRILEHSHTDDNGTSDADAPGNTFTRGGGPVDLAANDVVIVRAHMSNLDEYNGAVMRGSVAAGFETALDLDPDFAADLENADPQPEGCLF